MAAPKLKASLTARADVEDFSVFMKVMVIRVAIWQAFLPVIAHAVAIDARWTEEKNQKECQADAVNRHFSKQRDSTSCRTVGHDCLWSLGLDEKFALLL